VRLPPPRRVQSPDRLLNDVQDSVTQALRPVLQFEEHAGQRIDDLTLTATPLQISHGLGRCPIGWRVVDKTSAGDPYRTAWDERTITLRVASGTLGCDVYIW
jgi:hypothetical protein